jgi:hypothetical protein
LGYYLGLGEYICKQNESGNVPDSFFILEGSVPASFSPRKFKIMGIEAAALPVVKDLYPSDEFHWLIS